MSNSPHTNASHVTFRRQYWDTEFEGPRVLFSMVLSRLLSLMLNHDSTPNANESKSIAQSKTILPPYTAIPHRKQNKPPPNPPFHSQPPRILHTTLLVLQAAHGRAILHLTVRARVRKSPTGTTVRASPEYTP